MKKISNFQFPISNSKLGGFSLVEMLVAVGIFAIIALVTTQGLATTLKNSRKSDAISRTRVDVDYAISTIERLLRNAQSIDCQNSNNLRYVDENGNTTTLSCNSSGGFIASGSARLTSGSAVVDCTGENVFVCTPPVGGVPASVQITVKATDKLFGSGEEGAVVKSRTKVLLRNYLIY